jgi:hypothetical protein
VFVVVVCGRVEGTCPLGDVGLSGVAPGFVDLTWAGSAAGHSFADRLGSVVRSGHDPDGLKQFADLAA